MSGFKKLRLDPEFSNRNLSQPGASINDPTGRGYPDSSSFSSSTSGGNGGYSGARSAAGPFRARYSQPKGILQPGSATFSRFSPYYFGKERRNTLKVPLIRARRDDSDSDRPSSRASLNSSIGGDSTTPVTSTTAQRIIETLQNLSTPVTNAAKIRIDQDIKAVQPFFGVGSPPYRLSRGNALNRSSGPPKMCSGLLMSNPSPANQISPLADQRRLFCIPKMVDAATNTDRDREGDGHIASPPQQNKSGGEYQAPSTKPPCPSTSSSIGTSKKSITYGVSKEDSDDEEFHECSSDFTFSSAWSPDVFSKYFSNNEKDKDKSGGKGSTSQQPPLLNGFKDSTSTKAILGVHSGISSNLTSSIPPSQNFLGGMKPAGSGSIGFGISSSPKDIPKRGNEESNSTEASTKRKRAWDSNDSTTDANKQMSTSPLGTKSFKSGSLPISGLSSSKPASITHSLFGNSPLKPITPSSSFDKVDAAKTDISSTSTPAVKAETLESKPSLLQLTAKTSASEWKCPTCMVPNKLDTKQCVCCGEKNPKAASKVESSTAPPPLLPTSTEPKKKWRCPTCMVENELVAAACVCCSTKNPNPSTTPTATPVQKKWRCPTCMVENDVNAATCVCCSEKNPNPVGPAANKTDPAVSAQPTFKFGLSGNSPATSTFTFGSKTSSDSQSSKLDNSPGTFSFGSPASTSSTVSSSQSMSGSTFKFGLISAAATTTTSTSSTTKDSAATTSAPATSTFKFGATSTTTKSSPATPSFGFAASPSASTLTLPSSTTTTTTTTAPSLFGSSVKPVSLDSSVSSPKPSNAATVFGSPATATPPKTAPAVSTSSGSSNFVFGINSPLNPLAPKPASSTSSFGFSGAPSSAATPISQPSSTVASAPVPATTPSLFASSGKSITTVDTPKAASPAVFGSTGFSGAGSGGFNFGGNPTTTSDSQQKPTFNFGGSTPGKPAFSPPSFSFGGSSQTPGGFTPSLAAPTPSSQPVLGSNPPPQQLAPSSGFAFGSNNSNPNPSSSPFGQMPTASSNNPSQPAPVFAFGGSAPANPVVAPAPAQSFSFTPNLNFSAVSPGSAIPFGSPTQPTPNAGSQPPPALFQFSASPSTADRAGSAGRPIKRAVRRTRK